MIKFENHAFKGLDTEFNNLYGMIQQMAGMVSEQLRLFDEALSEQIRDNADAKQLDKKINALEIEIENAVAAILSRYTLIGDELRFTVTMLKLSSTLERMGDMAKNCVKRTVRLVRPVQPAFVSEARSLKKLIDTMLMSSMSLVQEYDETKAVALLAQEDEADGLYKKIQLLLQQDLGDHAQLVESTHMLFIIKNLERMADLALEIVKLCHYIHLGSKFERPVL
ncbi:MAG: PhoU domain-containing protein [Alphaproteobacteria bacterium]|nr:PhoU domain-containing protein [Alphaproteobacteria bacterium]